MQTTELNVEARELSGKGISRRLRREGKIPAVIYGKGHETRMLSVANKDVDKILNSKLGINTLIKLSSTSVAPQLVMIKDYQGHALSRALRHVDFLIVDENRLVTVFVPLHITGKAEGIVQGGLMDIVTREVELSCKPGKIPNEIVVDVTKLKLGQNLHLADIELPEGVTRKAAYNPTLVLITEVREEAAAVVAAPVEGAAAPAAGAAAAPGAAGARAAAPAAGGKAGAAAPAAAAGKAAPAAPAKKK
jgi:large subunit ribosomal protein L25